MQECGKACHFFQHSNGNANLYLDLRLRLQFHMPWSVGGNKVLALGLV